MPIDVDFTRLEEAARRIGAPEVDWRLDDLALDPLELLQIELEAGIEVELGDVQANAGDLLSYQGQHVLLYIKDHRFNLDRALSAEGAGNKYHVADCRKLKQMRAEGRFERYVATNNVTGSFIISGQNQTRQTVEAEAVLHVCQFCLDQLNYVNFKGRSWPERKEFVQQFSLDEFFETYSSYFDRLPRHTESTQPEPYGPEWDEISREYRGSVNWSCEECGVNLNANRRLLHVHHVNRTPYDHGSENLLALCLDCHSKQPGHRTMHVSRQDRRLINHLRNQDDINVDRTRPQNMQWQEAIRLSDPAVHGLLYMCQAAGYVIPEVGYEAVANDEVYAEVELAWPDELAAVAIKEDEGTKKMEQEGWTVLTPGKAMDDWFD